MAFKSDHHLRQTRRFIEENPSAATIKRRQRTSDGQGGFVTGSLEAEGTLSLDLGPVRRLARKNLSDTDVRTTSDGRQVYPTFVVVAEPEEPVEYLDVIVIGDEKYEVVHVSRNPEWRISAEVVEFRG